MLQDVHQQVHDRYQERECDEEDGGDGQEMVIPTRFPSTALRGDTVRRKIAHEPVDEYPHGKARNRACRVYGRLADDAHDAKEQEDGKRGEVVSRKDEGPGNEERNEHHYAVKQDDVEVVGGGRDVGFAHLDPEKRGEVGHGYGDCFLDEGEDGGEEHEFNPPIKGYASDACTRPITKVMHQCSTQNDPQQDESKNHLHRRHLGGAGVDRHKTKETGGEDDQSAQYFDNQALHWMPRGFRVVWIVSGLRFFDHSEGPQGEVLAILD